MHISQQQLQIISNYQPKQKPQKSLMQAAIAIILRDTDQGTEFLLMQRAKHENDPWSGQMAFPGGKIDPTDESSKAAAVREVHEEVGIVLSEDDYVGKLDDLYGIKVNQQFSVHVACYVYKPMRAVTPVGNYEVADLVWLSCSHLTDTLNAYDFNHPKGNDLKTPALLINEEKQQVLWGLTLRMLSNLYSLISWSITALPEEQQQELKTIQEASIDASELDSASQQKINQLR